MAIPNVLLSMQLSYNQLTRTEKKIADYVQKNAQKVLFMSITELAEECHVADASVHRFCRTIGAKGYQEFKMWLSINMGHEKGEEESEEEDGKEPIFQQVLKSHLEAINETNQLLDKQKVDQAVRMLTEARQIMFFGVGDSKTAAIEANNKFLHVTPKVMCAGDTHLQAMAASMMTEEDLPFVVSYSGSTKDTVEVAQIAKEAGAKVISITRFLKSPLTEFSDCVLICGSKEGPLEGGSMGAKLSQLHIIDILYQCYFKANGKKARENRQKTANAVVNKLY